MKSTTKNLYEYKGINIDVSPFEMQDSDLYFATNMYTHQFGGKKVRFGYTRFLDNPDDSEVKQLLYFNFPERNQKGILRISNSKTYRYSFTGSTWGTNLNSWSADHYLGNAIGAGSTGSFLHLTDGTTYTTYDGTNFATWSQGSANLPRTAASWRSRVFTDVNALRLVQSAVEFDTNSTVITGTVSGTNGNTTITGSGTNFQTIFPSGTGLLRVVVGNVNYTYSVTAVASNTSLTISPAYTQTTGAGRTAYYGSEVSPWNQSNLDAASAGSVNVNAGNNGIIQALSVVSDRITVYKSSGISRFNGQGIIDLPFSSSIYANYGNGVAHDSSTGGDYVISAAGIEGVDSNGVSPIGFGVNNTLYDTFATQIGVQVPAAYVWKYLTFFSVGTIVHAGETITNGIFVRDNRFGEWFIWSTANYMTAFTSFIDPDSGDEILISGDDEGTTYVWGETFSSDDGVAIAYHMRTKYFPFDEPDTTKIPDRISISTKKAGGAMLAMARNYTDQYVPVRFTEGYLSRGFVNPKIVPNFNTVSLEMTGDTRDGERPEFYGMSFKFKSMEERYDSEPRAGRG